MRSQTPQGKNSSLVGRQSVSKKLRASTSSLPVSRSQSAKLHPVRTTAGKQSSYNLYTGEVNSSGSATYPLPHRAVSNESAKENMAPPDAEEYEIQRRRIEELKAEIGTLKFSIRNLEQEQELRNLSSEQELRDVQARRDEDFKKKQEMQAERDAALRKVESLQSELDSLRTGVSEDKTGLEKKLREAQDEVRLLQEQLEDLAASKDEVARLNELKSTENQGQILALNRRVQELEQEAVANETEMERVQEQLRERDSVIADLEADVLRLKAQTGDAETIAIIRRELSDQVQHIRSLEATNRDQLSELKHLRQLNKSAGILEEEKRTLQRRILAAENLDRELQEANIQRQRLEDERRAWTAYLESVSKDQDFQFDSPEAVAKALVEERLHSASLLEQQGALYAEISEKESNIASLTEEKKALQNQAAKAKSIPPSSDSVEKLCLRHERQRELLSKEVEYLRAQLKAFDDEDVTFHSENYDEQRLLRVQELESLVDKYKEEVHSLQQQINSAEVSIPSPGIQSQALTGSKRTRSDDDDDERLGQMKRKARKLQDELSTMITKHQILEKELSVTQGQLHALKEQNKTRILALRSNPTSDFEAIKMSTLTGLKKENQELLAHIQDPSNRGTFKTVPFSTLEAAQREIEEAHAETASAKKSAQRLKEVWSSKSAEFKEAIFSTLGWTVTFIPNGKMRVESVFCPSLTDEHENSIVFDGERGTMKISGGPRSAFAQRIASQVKFWVREKNSIPGFLAALTLEFFDEHTRSSR